MSGVCVALSRSWCNFTKFLRCRVLKMPSESFAVFSSRSLINTVGLPMLERKWASDGHSSRFSSCSTLTRCRTLTDIENNMGCVRKVSSSTIMYTHDKESEMTVKTSGNSDSSSDSNNDTVSSESTKESSADSHVDTYSTSKAKPVSDVDVDRELLRYDYEEFEMIPDEEVSIVQPVKKSIPVELKRGTTGVYDVEEVVNLLRDEKARDICVIYVPPELKYVNYLVIVTGRSTRHLRAMAAYIKWAYKQKRSSSDPPSVKIEGELTNDWFALDLGNIAVHLFLEETRRMYDLETLWTVGIEHDDLSKDIMDDVTTSTTREDFSFDAELERLRKLRGYGNSSEQPAEPSADSMESQGNWHQQ